MDIVSAYEVPSAGTGRRDYSKLMEHAISAMVTTSERQTTFTITANFILPASPYPTGWAFAFPQPQEDGSWGWFSDIPVYWHELSTVIETNNLCAVGFRSYLSLADFPAVVHEYYVTKYGYGSSKVRITKGIAQSQGLLYVVWAAAWGTPATYRLIVRAHGLVAELTRPWMKYAP